jgi:hypothetical protein
MYICMYSQWWASYFLKVAALLYSVTRKRNYPLLIRYPFFPMTVLVTVTCYCYFKCNEIVTITDRGKRECMDPEGNGVTMSEGAEEGPGLPGGEQEKQSVCSSGGDKTSMGKPEGQPDRLDATT